MDIFLSALSDANATSQLFALLFSIVIKGAFILALTGLSVHFLRKSAATLRHLVWLCGMVVVLLLPVVVFVLPGLELAVVPNELAAYLEPGSAPAPADLFGNVSPSADAARESTIPLALYDDAATDALTGRAGEANNAGLAMAAEGQPLLLEPSPIRLVANNLLSLSWFAWALFVWAAGTILLLGRLLIAHLGVLGLMRRADRVDDDDWQLALESASNRLGVRQHVRLRKSDWLSVPVSVGLRRPTVILPSHAQEWDEETRQTVLLHELAHVRRRDCLIQLIVEVTRALYWVNPMVWIAAHHMKVERERACDDAVIVSGTTPSTYATALLDIARSITDKELSGAAIMAMARKSELEGRLLAILDSKPKLRTVNKAAIFLAVAVVGSFAIPVSILHFAVASSHDDVLAVADEAEQVWIVEDVHSTGRAAVVDVHENVTVKTIRREKTNRSRNTNRAVHVRTWDSGKGHGGSTVTEVHTSADKHTIVRSDRDARSGNYTYSFSLGDNGDIVIESVDDSRFEIAVDVQDDVDEAIAVLSTKIKGLESVLDSPVFEESGSGFGTSHPSRFAKPTRSARNAEDIFSPDAVLKLKRNGVDPHYVRDVLDAGFDASGVEEIVLLARNGVDSGLIFTLNENGFKFSAADIAKLSRNGVDEDLIDAAAEGGFRFCADEFAALTQAGVDEDILVAAGESGYHFDAKEFVKLSRNGVDEDLFELLEEWGMTNATVKELLELSRNGYCEDCITDAISVVGDSFRISDINKLINNGVDADLLCKMNEKGLLDLGVDKLIDLAKTM